eukprot:COSAG05_NODE_9391_length_627_cov_0.829545_2_plen_90_part_00
MARIHEITYEKNLSEKVIAHFVENADTTDEEETGPGDGDTRDGARDEARASTDERGCDNMIKKKLQDLRAWQIHPKESHRPSITWSTKQ